MSLWQQKKLRVQAASAAEHGGALANDNASTQIQMMMRQHRRDLKRIQSFEKKAEYKQKILPLYEPYIHSLLEIKPGVQDDVMMFVMLWRIDAGEYETALDIADYALKHKLTMPDGQSRTTGCAIADEIGDAAKKSYAAKKPISLDILQRAIDLTLNEDMPDKARGELYKWLGYSQRDNNLLQPALCSLMRALELDLNVGVKADIKQIEKALRSQQDKDQ